MIHRKEDLIVHTVLSLIRQRVYVISLCYEYLNDHYSLLHYVMIYLLRYKQQPLITYLLREQYQINPISLKNTFNLLYLTPENSNDKNLYNNILSYYISIYELILSLFVESYQNTPIEVLLYLYATYYPLHIDQ